MSAPVRPGDTAVIYAPLVRVEGVTEGVATVVAEGLLAEVPAEWLVPIHIDKRS